MAQFLPSFVRSFVNDHSFIRSFHSFIHSFILQWFHNPHIKTIIVVDAGSGARSEVCYACMVVIIDETSCNKDVNHELVFYVLCRLRVFITVTTVMDVFCLSRFWRGKIVCTRTYYSTVWFSKRLSERFLVVHHLCSSFSMHLRICPLRQIYTKVTIFAVWGPHHCINNSEIVKLAHGTGADQGSPRSATFRKNRWRNTPLLG